jgi:tRNA pseudouridine55 synthase
VPPGAAPFSFPDLPFRWRAGITLVHKPVGVTSHAVVRAAMAQLESSKLRLCHGGTLDPFASGLLLLLVGHATRLDTHLHALPKRYVATVFWGRETDTGDGGGRTVLESPADRLTPERLDDALRGMLGWREQIPPATSAKKVGGEPAYKKAHRGEDVQLPPSRVFLHRATWLSHALPHRSELELECRGGFYVRALVRDLGRAVGCAAHVEALRRTGIGPWEDPPSGERQAFRGVAVVPGCPERVISVAEYKVLKARGEIPAEPILPPRWSPPTTFPPLPPLVAGVLEDRLTFLLERSGQSLRSQLLFPGGM